MQFGRYLLENDVITPQDLVDALDLQRRDQIPIGEIGIAKGYLTYRDVVKVLSLRVDDKHASEFFGDVAIGLGLLNTEQVQELLHDQRETRKPLGRCLVETQCLDDDKFDRYSREFRGLAIA